ncbi:MAG TPA: hypothetical protein DGG94_13065 [Micromonosporaceae bacterium]|nr:hypothetical protein [Micromonosporaceae bacterium]HCU50711.1 hypothetical protein [Micromonosporaceae bacterium]
MWPLPLPVQSARETYRECIKTVSAPNLRIRLAAFEDAVSLAAQHFEAAAKADALFALDQTTYGPTSADDRKELVKVYTDRMAKQTAPGRHIYDSLKLAATRCPMCGHRDVSTLDHHLPKSGYPFLSVAPANLVPACTDCNKAKRNTAASTADEQPLHPYFDNVNSIQWLTAEVIELRPAALRFYVRPDASWSATLTTRVRRHFQVLQLGALYGAQAATELSGIAYAVQLQHFARGPEGVREFLEDQAESRRRSHLNHWTTATYQALAGNFWYHNGGFA